MFIDAVKLVMLAVALVAAPSAALADAIEPRPSSCPSGTTPHSGHDGSFCEAPPPEDCPEGYAPRAFRETPYCEPPPPTACPPGSHFRTARPNGPGACWPGQACEAGQCPAGQRCQSSGLCINTSNQDMPRYADYSAHGPCTSDEDCDDGHACEVAMRCHEDPPRADPEGRRLPAIIRPIDTGTCGCRVPGAPRGGAPWAAVGLVLGLGMMWRTRR